MKRHAIVALLAACALAMPLAACNAGGSDTGAANGSAAANSEQTGDFDAVEAYWGQWRGSVAITGTTVYGTAGGSEQMLDVNLEQDGTCTVVPLEAHADLLNDSGTWEGTESQITLHLEGAGDVTLTVVDNVTLEGTASDFDIADFETIDFDFYG